VARIKVSPWGYGKALYIAHPNGYTSVYGHMSAFKDRIDSLVSARQYSEHEFEQDIYLEYGTLEVKQGQVIGLSGNSGGSGGPHLHFEIRESASQKPLNPLFFGYDVVDTRKPDVIGVKLSSIGSGFYVQADVAQETYLPVEKLPDTIDCVEGKVAIGIHGFDKHDAGANKNGIFRVEMLVNDESHILWTMDKTSFDQGRYVNAFRDFSENKKRRTIYNCYRLPGNALEVYEYLVDDGFVHLGAGEKVKIEIQASDFHKHVSIVSFYLKGIKKDSSDESSDAAGLDNAFNVAYNESHSFIRPGFQLNIPAGTLYDNAQFFYQVKETDDPSIYSDMHQFHDAFVPIHKRFVAQVKPYSLPKGMESKVVLAHMDLRGVEQSLTTFWKDGMVSAKCREVGWFYVRTDTKPPHVRWLNLTEKTKTFRGEQIRVHLEDDLSGIKDYNGYIDGKWVVFDYDAKRNLLTYDFDQNCPPGEHSIRMVVIDKVNNETELKTSFTLQ